MNDELKIISELDLPYDNLKGKKILITGATGLIGWYLIKALEEVNKKYNHIFEIYIGGRSLEKLEKCFPEVNEDIGLKIWHYDMNQPIDESVDFSYIFALAGNASPYYFSSKPIETMCENFEAVKNLLEYTKVNQACRLVYVSTGEVYGQAEGVDMFFENYSGPVESLSARSCYPVSKKMCETLCAAYKEVYNIDFVVARPCHIYGPNASEMDNRAYIQFLRNAVSGHDIVMKSSGTQVRSYCYIADCIAEILYIALKGVSGEAYNISNTDSVISIREMAEEIATLAGKRVILEIPDEAEAKGYNKVQRSVLSDEKIRNLGYIPRYTIQEGLKRTFLSMKERKRVKY